MFHFSVVLIGFLLIAITLAESSLLRRVVAGGKGSTVPSFNQTKNATNIDGTVFEQEASRTDNNISAVTNNNMANSSQTQDSKKHDIKIHETILNIENIADNSNVPLHKITVDTEKKIQYRKNVLRKSILQKVDKSRVNINEMSQHVDIKQEIDAEDKSQQHVALDEPSVIIKGAKLITAISSELPEKHDQQDARVDGGDSDATSITAQNDHENGGDSHTTSITVRNDHANGGDSHALLNTVLDGNGTPPPASEEIERLPLYAVQDAARFDTSEQKNSPLSFVSEDSQIEPTLPPTFHARANTIRDGVIERLADPLIDFQSQLNVSIVNSPNIYELAKQLPFQIKLNEHQKNVNEANVPAGSPVSPISQPLPSAQSFTSSPGSAFTSATMAADLDDRSTEVQYITGRGGERTGVRNDKNVPVEVTPTVDESAVKQTLNELSKNILLTGSGPGTMVFIPKTATVSSENRGTIETHLSPNTNDNPSYFGYVNGKTSDMSAVNMYSRAPNVNSYNTHNTDRTHDMSEIKNYDRNKTPVMSASSSQSFGDGVSRTGSDNSNVQRILLPTVTNNQQLRTNLYIKPSWNSYQNAISLQNMNNSPAPAQEYNPNVKFQSKSESNSALYTYNAFNKPMTSRPFTSITDTVKDVQYDNTVELPVTMTTYNAQKAQNVNNNVRNSYNKIRILCIGDSLTSGYYGDRHIYHPFSVMLAYLLNVNIANEFELITKGVGGEKVRQMYARLRSLLTSERPLDLIIILSGLNDLIKLDINVDIFAQIVVLHELCHAYGVSTVSMTIPETRMPLSRQVYANYDQFLVVWGSLNEKIRHYSSNWTIPCDLARQFPLASLSDPEKRAWWSEDYIHPTIEGYNQMGRIIYDCIVAIL